MEMKKVTLVIPMYYEEKVVEECYKAGASAVYTDFSYQPIGKINANYKSSDDGGSSMRRTEQHNSSSSAQSRSMQKW